MHTVQQQGAPAPRDAISGASHNGNAVTLAQLVQDYVLAYTGRDSCTPARLEWWKQALGPERPVAEISDDDVFHALDRYAKAPARVYMGLDVDRKPIYRSKGHPPSGATVNRMQAALGSLITWGVRQRRLPRGHQNPTRGVQRQRESDGRVRFLTDDERARLLTAARAAKWKKLYAFVVMGITTGARRSELLGLTWADIDFERALAHVNRSKNGDRKTLPLVPVVLEELQRFRSKVGTALVFASARRPSMPFCVASIWPGVIAAAGIKDFRIHDLRHTCASYLAQSGASILEVADVLGHRSLAMTRRYAHLTVKTKAALVGRVLGDIR